MKGDLKVFYRTKDNKCLCLKHALIQMEQVDTYVSRQENYCSICFMQNYERIKKVNNSFLEPSAPPAPRIITEDITFNFFTNFFKKLFSWR